MPAAHPPELRRRALDLVARGNPVGQTARDLGISESRLRNWMNRDVIDSGRKPGITTDEHKELLELRRRNRVLEMGIEILKRAPAISASGYYDWVSPPASPRAAADAELMTTIRRIHADSRETYGTPRVLAELRLPLTRTS